MLCILLRVSGLMWGLFFCGTMISYKTLSADFYKMEAKYFIFKILCKLHIFKGEKALIKSTC